MEEDDYFEGWLTRKTLFKSKKYWCTLSEGFLYYWKDKIEPITRVKPGEASNCKEKFDLYTAHTVRESLSANSPPFSIDIVTKKDKKFTLIACNKRELDLWVKHMQTAMHDKVRQQSRKLSLGSLNLPSSFSSLSDTMDTPKDEGDADSNDVFEKSSVGAQQCCDSNHDNTQGTDCVTTSAIPQQQESVKKTQSGAFACTNSSAPKALPVATVRPFSLDKSTTCTDSFSLTKVPDTVDDNSNSPQNDDEKSCSSVATADVHDLEILYSSADDVEKESTVTVKMRSQSFLNPDSNGLTNDEVTRIVSQVWGPDPVNQCVTDAISVAEQKYSLMPEKVRNHSLETRVPEAQQLSDLLTILTPDGILNSNNSSNDCDDFDSNYMQLLLEALEFSDNDETNEIF